MTTYRASEYTEVTISYLTPDDEKVTYTRLVPFPAGPAALIEQLDDLAVDGEE